MADWATISSLATAAGTLVLAAATFSAVRSSNRSARVAERSLLAGLRPVLVPSKIEDPAEKVLFADLRWFRVTGGHAVVEHENGSVFLVMGVRNVGTGLAVLRGWLVHSELLVGSESRLPDPESFRNQGRDIYIPAGDAGFWQGAIREPDDPERTAVIELVVNRESFTIDLLYGDGEGGQRVISRFAVIPVGDEAWLVTVSRHWNLDRDDRVDDGLVNLGDQHTGFIGGVEKVDIVLADYDLEWPRRFEAERTKITGALGGRALAIDHVGSTSVPGLAAKPIVDIDLAVADSSDEGAYLPDLVAAGYELRVREPDWHEHRMFRTPEHDVHLHVFTVGSPEIVRNLVFRDRLRTEPSERELYQATKQALASRDWPTMQHYADAKSDVVEAIVARAFAVRERERRGE